MSPNLVVLLALAAPAGALRLEVPSQPLPPEAAKPATLTTGPQELGFEVWTETRYRVLPDGRIELSCSQRARPSLQGAVRERRRDEQPAEDRP